MSFDEKKGCMPQEMGTNSSHWWQKLEKNDLNAQKEIFVNILQFFVKMNIDFSMISFYVIFAKFYKFKQISTSLFNENCFNLALD